MSCKNPIPVMLLITFLCCILVVTALANDDTLHPLNDDLIHISFTYHLPSEHAPSSPMTQQNSVPVVQISKKEILYMIFLIIYEIIVRRVPTNSENWSILTILRKLANKIVPNNTVHSRKTRNKI